jgi:hypothetical protein
MTKKRIRPPRTAAQLRRIAIHEAGHAVVGRVLKQVCGEATIVANITRAKPATPSRRTLM